MARRNMAQTEAQYSRVKTALAQRTPNPSVGLGSLSNMGGQDSQSVCESHQRIHGAQDGSQKHSTLHLYGAE